MMTLTQAQAMLAETGQASVLRFWDRLEDAQRQALLAQIEGLDWSSLPEMRALLPNGEAGRAAVPEGAFEPAPVTRASGSERLAASMLGETALRAGEVGVILVAGGQGTRLGFDGPKGTYPLDPETHATLFEIHARKLLALQRRAGARIPLYVMTSPENDAPTRAFFDAHSCFGLDTADVKFFAQGMLPALTPDGQLVLEAPGRLFLGPDGHGGLLAALDRHGMLEDMQRRGLTTLFYFQVDNPLVEIADPVFVGMHLKRMADISVKVCAKRDPNEGLGVVVRRNGRWGMVEYTELTEAQKSARRPDGTLVLQYGSVAIHIFTLEFLRHEARIGLPLHRAHKKVPACNAQGRTIKPAQPNAYKFERFIFDVLPDAGEVLVLEFDREDEFAPVKNAEGPDSPATARAAMLAKLERARLRASVNGGQ